MAAGSLTASGLLFIVLRPILATDSSAIRAVAADHWRYGKWVAAAAGPAWVTDNIYYVVLPAWVGLTEAGGLKALMNLAQPALQASPHWECCSFLSSCVTVAPVAPAP